MSDIERVSRLIVEGANLHLGLEPRGSRVLAAIGAWIDLLPENWTVQN
jgi:hypothetical protein